jgi:septal ring factor EnvC (AmiA/AmiB activator)
MEVTNNPVTMNAPMQPEKQPPAVLEQLETAWEVQERPFTSPTPVIGPLLAWLRTAWNNIATKWYVRAVVQQQNEFNRLAVQQFHEVEQGFAATATQQTALDGRLVAQDHEQSDLIHDVGELTAQLIQLKRQLQAMEERLVALEAEKETQANTSGRDRERD